MSNEAETDDILQEVFLRVNQHLEQLKDPDRLFPWMFHITRRVIIDYYRSHQRRREVPVGLTTILMSTMLMGLLSRTRMTKWSYPVVFDQCSNG